MRVVDSAITAYEEAGNLQPTETLVASREILSFAAFTTQVNASLDTGVPQSFAARDGGTYCYATHRYTNGTSRLQVMTLSTAANWALSGGAQVNANTVLVMRNGVFTDASNASWLYTAAASGSAIQVKRQQINAITSDPPTVSLSNYGVTFGDTLADTATLVRRVEAVCPTDGGVVVAAGTHDFANDLSTIQFWWLPDASTAIQLDAIIQATLSETYTNWYSAAKWATFICAGYDATNGIIRIIANAHPNGQAVQFDVKTGVCSAPRPVVPVDAVYGSVYFRASSISKIGSLYCLSGRITYALEDGSSDARDVYLTSADGELWSIGERNYFAHAADSAGTLLVDTASTPVYLYYGGNLNVSRASATPAQGYNTATLQLDVTDRLQPNYSINQVSGGPHRFSGELENHEGTLDANAIVRRGSVVYLDCGQHGTNSDFGVYGLDTPSRAVSGRGRGVVKFSARDIASKMTIRHNAPLDVDWYARSSLITSLATDDGLVIKTRTSDILQLDANTPEDVDLTGYDVTLGSAGLRCKSLNNPLVAYADIVDAGDVFMKATVTFPNLSNAYALPSFTFILNGADDGSFIGVSIPKTNSWGSKTRPRAVRSNLKPYDEATDSGGFTFEKRWQGWWYSNNYDANDNDLKYLQAVLELPSHYTTEPAFTQDGGTTCDYITRLAGPRVQVFSKVRDFAPATCSTNAPYALISEYLFDDDTRLRPDGRVRPGFALNTDVWAKKTVFESAAFGATEVALTSAANYSNYGTAFTLPPGVDQIITASTASIEFLNGGAPAVIDLRDYFYVGQWLRSNTNGTIQDRQISSIQFDGANYSVLWMDGNNTVTGGCTLALRSGDYWGQASSAPINQAIQNSSTTFWRDPGAVRTFSKMLARIAFVGTDTASSLFAPRWCEFNGVIAYLLQGSPDTDEAWDTTSPISTDATAWKAIAHHNGIMRSRASTDGLSTEGFMMNEQEAIRYEETEITTYHDTLNQPAVTTEWITHVPTYIATPATQSVASATVSNKFVGADRPGDDLGAITDPAGLLFEISQRNGMAQSDDVPGVYVTAAGTNAGVGYVTLDTVPGTPITDSNLVIVSGRAQLGTKKVTHPSDAAVCYYPAAIGATALHASMVTVPRFAAFSGRLRTVEDALKYLCALAGVRNTTFRNLMTGAQATADWTATLTTTPQNLPLVETLSDFVLDLSAHIPITTWLRIDFRGYYRLAIRQSSAGYIQVGLQTTSTDIDVDGGGLRWFELSPGLYISGTNICPAATDNAAIRIGCIGSQISVEVNGADVILFDIGDYVHTDGTSYAVYTPGAIALSYSASVASNSASARVPELWMEQSFSMAMGANTNAQIRRICDKHQILSWATAGGGLGFSQFITRPDGGTVTKAIREHGAESDDVQPVAHVFVAGQQSGAHFNATYAADEGYSFAVTTDSEVDSVQQASATAQLQVRETVEFSSEETVTADARCRHEVEDMIELSYAPGGTLPAQTARDCVITAIDITRTRTARIAKYKLREYTAWQ